MNVTANVSRRTTYLNQVGKRPTMESYLLAMEPYIIAISARSAAAIDLGPQEDLEQEARMTLVTVFTEYRKNPPIDLYKIGTRAIANHFRDMYERSMSVGRGGVSPNQIRRGWVKPGHHQPIQVLSGDAVLDHHRGETRMTTLFDTIAAKDGSPLDRLLVREALDKILESATAVERRTFRAAMRPEGLDTTEARALFRNLRGKVRKALSK